MKVHDVEQNSSEWEQLRAGKPTASAFSRIITGMGKPSDSMREYAEELATELYAGKPLNTWSGNKYSDYGHETEEEARYAYELRTGIAVEQIGFVTDDAEQYGCSPDAKTEDGGGLEIKCLPKKHVFTLLYWKKHGKAPTNYIAQTQGQLFVTGWKYVDLFFYRPDLPNLVIRHEPNPVIFAALAKPNKYIHESEIAIEHTEKDLKTLAKKYTDVKEIKNDADYQMVKSGGIELQRVRISIEKAGKAARDDANKFAKAVIAEERRLTGIISPEEDRLKALRKEVDDREAREAEEKRQAERARVQALTDKLTSLRQLSAVLPQDDSTSIQDRIDTAMAIDPTTFEEFSRQADESKNDVLRSLTESLRTRLEFEKQKEEQDRIAAEQAKEREKIEQERAEAARVMREAQEKAATVEAEKRAEEEKKLAAERAEAEKIRKEKERLEAEVLERQRSYVIKQCRPLIMSELS